jgi:hypothetical protein
MPKGHVFEFIPKLHFLWQYDSKRLKEGYYFAVETTTLGQQERTECIKTYKDIQEVSKNPHIIGVNYYETLDKNQEI